MNKILKVQNQKYTVAKQVNHISIVVIWRTTESALFSLYSAESNNFVTDINQERLVFPNIKEAEEKAKLISMYCLAV